MWIATGMGIEGVCASAGDAGEAAGTTRPAAAAAIHSRLFMEGMGPPSWIEDRPA
jgi:hypothetical protein